MMLKRSTTESKPSAKARLVRAGVASLAAVSAIAALATGCLDRPVVEAAPKTSNLFVDQIVQTAVDKIDLLFMIDNSVSMADKQEILKSAVPLLVTRLVTPACVDGMGVPLPNGAHTDDAGNCATGAAEFTAIGDIHIGIVSSSLGAHAAASARRPPARMITWMTRAASWRRCVRRRPRPTTTAAFWPGITLRGTFQLERPTPPT